MSALIPTLEVLEGRSLPSVFDLLAALAPHTSLHYAPADNFSGGTYAPASAGFNLADVTSPAQLALVPPGDKALVNVQYMLGNNPDFKTFTQFIKPFVGDPRVFGFYLADEPNPATVPAANLKAESDWIHANDPGAKTFIVLGAGPFFPWGPRYTPQNTDMDYVGLDPYPTRTWGYHPEYIPLAMFTAELFDGWGRDQIVPVYQAFGDFGSFAVPNTLETDIDLAIWGMLTPHPAFDYAYSWGEWGASSLVDHPELQAVFLQHNT